MVTNEELLRSQWAALRRWIEASGILQHAQEQSVLEAWNVHELVTHLGRSFLDFPVLGPAPGAEPRTLREYVSGYGASARDIADGTKQLARSFAGDVLAGIDNCARLGTRRRPEHREVEERATDVGDELVHVPRLEDALLLRMLQDA